MGLHFGGFIVWRGVLVAPEPASRSVNKTSLSASRNADRLRNGLLRSVGACRLRVARPGPAVAHGCRSQAQVLWLAYGSARQAARSSETAIAFACACMRGIETAITFAGEKRAFLVQFPGAKVSLVSMVAVRGRALVLWVSKSRVGVHCTRLFSPCSAKSAREREKVRPACSREPKNRCFMACWASFFAEMPMVGVCWGVTAGRDPVGSRPVSRAARLIRGCSYCPR